MPLKSPPVPRMVLHVIMTLMLCAAGRHVTAQTEVLTSQNWERLVPLGKETDAIYDDFALKSPAATAIIARPASTRHANMTVRDVGGCLIDLAAAGTDGDQLSAFYPGRRKFPFTDASIDGDAVVMSAPGTAARVGCEVRYELHPSLPVISVTSTWT
ncbi:MAG: hypothetical protein KDA89_21950, partial [Planctomycetaceae bacterium]|nr:hypothetical protein [Planctomycetaceae bacterium]